MLAISANSPFYEDRDTGYASWRSQVWTRWPSSGSPQTFGSLEAYRAAGQFLLDSGAARDPGMFYFDARLSVDHPTVEIRVSDMCTDPAEHVLVAAVVRGLVETAAARWHAGDESPVWRAEQLRACHWRAAKYGVTDALVHPGLPRPAWCARGAGRAGAEIAPRCRRRATTTSWSTGWTRVLSRSGATAQRAAYERTGDVSGVVDDLVERTRASWSD